MKRILQIFSNRVGLVAWATGLRSTHTVRKSFLPAMTSIAFLAALAAASPVAQGQAAHFEGYTSTLVSGLNYASEVVIDTNGNLYIADAYNGRVLKETLNADGTYTQSIVVGGLTYSYGLAVDRSATSSSRTPIMAESWRRRLPAGLIRRALSPPAAWLIPTESLSMPAVASTLPIITTTML